MRRSLTRRGGRWAVTLTEMLIVISVLGLLLAIVVPTVSRVAALARSAICQDHLRRIAEAYLDHKIGERLDYSDGVFAANIWPAQVMPLMAWQSDVLFCPEDPEPYWSLPEVGLTIYSYGGLLYQVQAFDAAKDRRFVADVHESVMALAARPVGDGNEIWVGTVNGKVLVLDGHGRLTAEGRVPGLIDHLAVSGSRAVLVTSSGGGLALFEGGGGR